MVAEALLDGLNPAQREAVTCEGEPVCILAGAGSGKTRVLTRRIAWRVAQGSAQARHTLVLTFTRKAAGELVSRLGGLGVREHVGAGTFHALAYAQLRRRWADRGETPPALLDRKVRLLTPLLPRRSHTTVQPGDVAAEIEWAKARMVRPRAYEGAARAAERTPPLPFAELAAIYDRYEQEKRRKGLVDFDDLLLRCAQALEQDREFAAVQRWRFRHLFVDELQDVNPVQARLLDGWRGGRHDMCVVGDPDQAIYSWNGADAGHLVGFARRFPTATVVRLDDNYRSTAQVLAVANAVLADGDSPGRRRAGLRAHRADGSLPTVTSYPSDRDEARAVARALRDRRSTTRPWSHMAVLARTNAQLVLFEEALRAAGVAHQVKGGGSFLRQPEVADALRALRRLPRVTPVLSAMADLDEVIAEGDDQGASAAAERRRHLEALVRLGHEHAATDPGATVESFLAWLDVTVRADAPDHAGDAVALATFHAAKGLEWPVVFVTGLERGLVPIAHADSPAARAEERRLLYVAVTRAEQELHCSWAERRTYGARTSNRSPSPWVGVIDAAVRAAAQGETSSDDWRAHLAAGKARLGAASAPATRRNRPVDVGANADPAVYDALRSWRATTAKASGVPAFVIFHDSTLAAVAEAKPGTQAALLCLPGMGPVKAERYGEALLALVAGHSA